MARPPALVILIVIALFVPLMITCGGSSNASGERLTIVKANGKQAKLSIEVAETPDQKTTGLSNRAKLAKDAGMLFILVDLSNPRRDSATGGFWMKDTLIPLSVAFIDRCGALVDIAHMEPLTLDVHRTTKPHSFGLEVNKGWFEEKGVKVGDHVQLPARFQSDDCS
jgi:uncharacterized membrane protein (UPF0127 family)